MSGMWQCGLTYLPADETADATAPAAALPASVPAVPNAVPLQARNVFCAVRPPGHHAGPTGKVPSQRDPIGSHGFCLLNNLAIAAAYAVNAHRHAGKLKHCAWPLATFWQHVLQMSTAMQEEGCPWLLSCKSLARPAAFESSALLIRLQVACSGSMVLWLHSLVLQAVYMS